MKWGAIKWFSVGELHVLTQSFKQISYTAVLRIEYKLTRVEAGKKITLITNNFWGWIVILKKIPFISCNEVSRFNLYMKYEYIYSGITVY